MLWGSNYSLCFLRVRPNIVNAAGDSVSGGDILPTKQKDALCNATALATTRSRIAEIVAAVSPKNSADYAMQLSTDLDFLHFDDSWQQCLQMLEDLFEVIETAPIVNTTTCTQSPQAGNFDSCCTFDGYFLYGSCTSSPRPLPVTYYSIMSNASCVTDCLRTYLTDYAAIATLSCIEGLPLASEYSAQQLLVRSRIYLVSDEG